VWLVASYEVRPQRTQLGKSVVADVAVDK